MSHRRRRKNIFHILCFFWAVVVLTGPGVCYPQGLESLSGKISGSILDYFAARGESKIRFAIVKFENFSGISDLAAHKFYQQLAASLEGRPPAIYKDLMIDFNQKKGEFNLNRVDDLDYLIYLKLIRNLDKVGAGITIFSRSLDKIVYIKYFEEDFSAGERNIYETVDYGFRGLGFSRQIEIDADKHLLDFKSIVGPAGSGSTGDADEVQYFFFYPGEIKIFKSRDNQFRKFFSIKLDWGRPYYPVMDYEGKLCLFYQKTDDGGPVLYLTAGCNFSPHAKILVFKNNLWQEIDTLDFVPLKAIRLNNNDYLAGALYDGGKNYFKDKLLLVPFVAGKLEKENPLEKRIVPFYAMDFSNPAQQPRDVAGVHVIDTNYNSRFFSGDFQEPTPAPGKRGSALAVLDGQWLALSEYSFSTRDKLYFYKIEEGGKQAVYENPINGRVIFISAGYRQDRSGFWVYVEEMKNDTPAYRLQFWTKNIDKEEGNN